MVTLLLALEHVYVFHLVLLLLFLEFLDFLLQLLYLFAEVLVLCPLVLYDLLLSNVTDYLYGFLQGHLVHIVVV